MLAPRRLNASAKVKKGCTREEKARLVEVEVGASSKNSFDSSIPVLVAIYFWGMSISDAVLLILHFSSLYPKFTWYSFLYRLHQEVSSAMPRFWCKSCYHARNSSSKGFTC